MAIKTFKKLKNKGYKLEQKVELKTDDSVEVLQVIQDRQVETKRKAEEVIQKQQKESSSSTESGFENTGSGGSSSADENNNNKSLPPDEILEATDCAFYYVQHKKSAELVDGFKQDSNNITDGAIEKAQKIFTVKSGLNKLDGVPGQDHDDFYAVFEKGQAALMNEEDEAEYKKAVDFNAEKGKIDSNIIELERQTCESFKLNVAGKTCDEANIFQAVKTHFCSNKGNIESKNCSDINADKAFCADGINDFSAWFKTG